MNKYRLIYETRDIAYKNNKCIHELKDFVKSYICGIDNDEKIMQMQSQINDLKLELVYLKNTLKISGIE